MKKNNKKGFTLVELVIVVAVMAILVAVAIPTVASITGSAKEAVYDSNCRTIESVLKLAEAEKSKAANGVATLSAPEVYEALTDAKLGLDTTAADADYFYYHTFNGTVDDSSTQIDSTDTVITIKFVDGVAQS